jgi:hypothetical protein
VSSEDFPQGLASDWRWLWDRLLGSSRIRRVLDAPSGTSAEELPPKVNRAEKAREDRARPAAKKSVRPLREKEEWRA